ALRQEFIEEIGGYDQNVSDPEYYRRWGEAQQLLDEEVRTQLGEEAFNRLQNESVTHVATTATSEKSGYFVGARSGPGVDCSSRCSPAASCFFVIEFLRPINNRIAVPSP